MGFFIQMTSNITCLTPAIFSLMPFLSYFFSDNPVFFRT
ncbi:hypothetical protein RU86_GL001126 [Lactococcus piscium]|uniref:Uncharacterized protein n=1 Tax=Pseudolactococcus piscium TaxID=1364 RepID=A0A2A5S5L8_9LACT|nr:hypothetical protein RU86_GL001126 [Lactococcus piscium]